MRTSDNGCASSSFSLAAQGIKGSHTSREAWYPLFECVKQRIQESIGAVKRYQPSQPLSLYQLGCASCSFPFAAIITCSHRKSFFFQPVSSIPCWQRDTRIHTPLEKIPTFASFFSKGDVVSLLCIFYHPLFIPYITKRKKKNIFIFVRLHALVLLFF